MPDAPAPAPLTCPSCNAPRTGQWCAECGEYFLQSHDLSLGHFVLKVLPHEAFEFDGKLLRTMRLLLAHPGALPAAYVAGRRRPYITPLRLCLMTFLLYAFVGVLVGHADFWTVDRARTIDPTGLLVHMIDARPHIDWTAPQLREQVAARAHWLSEFGTLSIFLLVAIPQKLIFLRLQRRYLEHAALALSVGAFYISIVTLIRASAVWFWHGQHAEETIQALVGLTALPLYWFFAIRNFYRISMPAALGAALLVTASHIVIANIISVAIFAFLIATA
jgi:hypothetical protein